MLRWLLPVQHRLQRSHLVQGLQQTSKETSRSSGIEHSTAQGAQQLTSDRPGSLVGALSAAVLASQDLSRRASDAISCKSSSSQDDAAQADPTTFNGSVTEVPRTPGVFVVALRVGRIHALCWEQGAPPSRPVRQCSIGAGMSIFRWNFQPQEPEYLHNSESS